MEVIYSLFFMFWTVGLGKPIVFKQTSLQERLTQATKKMRCRASRGPKKIVLFPLPHIRLGKRAVNYTQLETVLLKKRCHLECNMSLKMHFLFSYLVIRSVMNIDKD